MVHELCLVCLPGVSWLLCGSSSRCHGFVCSLLLWYFLIMLAYYFSNNLLFTCCFRDPNQPMPVGVDWPEFTSDGQQYLHITRNMSPASVKRHLIGGRLHLWNKVIPPLLRTLYCCLEACQDGPYGGVGWTSPQP